MTKNKVHEDFKAEMQNAWEEYVIEDTDDIEIPEPDLLFLENTSQEKKEDEQMQLDFLTLKRKPSPFKRFAKVAVIFLAILITSSAVGVYLSSESSYGVKNFFLNIKHFVIPSEPAVDENDTKTLTVSDWDEIEKGREVVGTLYAPEYIPPKYKFDSASFDSNRSFLMTMYEYTRGNRHLDVAIQVIMDDTDAFIQGDLCKSPISGKAMYLEEDQETGERIITYPDKDKTFSVTSEMDDVSKNDAFKIVESIEKKPD